MMTKTAGALAVLASCTFIGAAGAQDLGPQVKKLADGVYVHTGRGFESNSGIILTQDGVERVVGHGAAGAFLGEISVLTGVARSATARAVGPVRAFRISGEDVRAIVKKYRHVVARLESAMQVKHAPRRSAAVRVLPAPDDPNSVILHEPKGGTYLRLSTRSIRQIERQDDSWREGALAGGYWLKAPGPNAEGAIVAMGAVMPRSPPSRRPAW